MAEVLRGQQTLERQIGEVDQGGLLGSVAVRKRRHREATGKARQTWPCVGPRREALPGMRQLFASIGIESFQAVVMKYLVQRQAVEPVEVGPWQLTAAHPIHRRDVQRAPCIGQALPVTMNAVELADPLRFSGHTRAPIHRGAEYIKRQSSHCAQIGRRQSRNTILARGVG